MNINDTVIATRVAEAKRLAFLPRHFEAYLGIFERGLYAQMNQLCTEYRGGWWEMFDLSNGGCYLAPEGTEYRMSVAGNGFDGKLTADAAGITVTLFTLCHLGFRFPSQEVFTIRFLQLREFAALHAERRQIFAAID